jgi:S-adenosylhomocysteine hydrolase
MFPTQMPVINALLKTANSRQLFKETLFVCVQHLLYTSIDLLDALIYLGAEPHHIFLLGKIYSTHPEVSKILARKGIQLMPNAPLSRYGAFAQSFKQDGENMWLQAQTTLASKKINKIIVLDDGGACIAHMPLTISKIYNTIGVEQTSSGLFYASNAVFPVIQVASSAAKQYLEAPMIAEAIEEKLNHTLLLSTKKKLRCGVIGLGVIGKAIIKKLLQYGHIVYSYDRDPHKNISIESAHKVNKVEDLLTFSDYIFGCTGRDVFEGINFKNCFKKAKVLISCSSKDIEFHSLLKTYTEKDHSHQINTLKTVVIHLEESIPIKVLRGGFPINLDNYGYSVPSHDIQMTRGLLLAGMIQAALLTDYHSQESLPRFLMLSPFLQHFIVNEWLFWGSPAAKQNPFLNNFSSIDWIIRYSGGQIFNSCLLETASSLPL